MLVLEIADPTSEWGFLVLTDLVNTEKNTSLVICHENAFAMPDFIPRGKEISPAEFQATKIATSKPR